MPRVEELLHVAPIGGDSYEGLAPERAPRGVFGGQIIGQALHSAGLFVGDDELHPQSLHAYFVAKGTPGIPIRYNLTTLGRGRNTHICSVAAMQGERLLASVNASFQRPGKSLSHSTSPRTHVLAPETYPGVEDYPPSYRQMTRTKEHGVDVRFPEGGGRLHPEPTDVMEHFAFVFRLLKGQGEEVDALTRACVLAYVSDLTLLDALLDRHSMPPGRTSHQLISYDHTMWFYGLADITRWCLFEQTSPVADLGRGLAFGRVYDEDERLLCVVAQEGGVRSRK